MTRGVGCIMYEMATGRPMFPGSTVKEELHLIFRLMGKRDISCHFDYVKIKLHCYMETFCSLNTERWHLIGLVHF